MKERKRKTMSEYGSGVSLVQAFNYDKERLLQALRGRLLCGETEEGFEYCEAPESECRAEIIALFDNAVYHALQGYQSGRVLEKTTEANGIDTKSGQFFKDYMHFRYMDELQQMSEEEYNYGDPENLENEEE